MSQRENVLHFLKQSIINKLKETEHVEFYNAPSLPTQKIAVVVYDQTYKTAVERMAVDTLLYKIIKSFKNELKKHNENSSIRIKNISINVDNTNDFEGDKYLIVFEVLE